MLPLPNRLKRDNDFRVLFKKGKSIRTKLIHLRLKKNELPHSRFAVVVSTKVSKSAVKRNRLRRQVREVIRLNMEKLTSGYDVAVMVQKEALGAKYEVLETDVLQVLKKAKLL